MTRDAPSSSPNPVGMRLMRLLRAYLSIFSAIVRAFRLPRVQALLLICLTVAVTQALIFRWIEGWRFLDAFYFSVVSMATVGYGDLTPQTSLGKVAAMGFLVIGIGVFVLAVSSVAQAILRELLVAEDGEGRDAGGFRLGRGEDEGPAAASDLGRRG
jgi:voltage-gated potassium channel